MADVDLRRIHEEEWDSLRDVRLRALLDAPDAFGSSHERESLFSEEDWRGWARTASHGSAEICVVAWAGEDAVGVVAAFVEDDSDHAHLIAMWVAPAARRRGIGEFLVGTIVAWASEAGLVTVRLEVVESNGAATRLYERCGFVPTGRSRPYDDRPHLVAVELERSAQ